MRTVPVVAAVVALTGCGVEGTQFNPGVAARVGDQTITTQHVDQVTADLCEFAEEQGGDSSQINQLPMRYLTHEVANALTLQAASEQLAEEYGVGPGAAYDDTVGQLASQLPDDLSDDQRDAVVEFQSAGQYYQDVLVAIGTQELTDAGTSDATPQQQYDAGKKVLLTWADENDVEVNPKYGVDLGEAGQSDTDTSVAVSSVAEKGLAAEPDDTYAAGLSGNLVCGG